MSNGADRQVICRNGWCSACGVVMGVGEHRGGLSTQDGGHHKRRHGDSKVSRVWDADQSKRQEDPHVYRLRGIKQGKTLGWIPKVAPESECKVQAEGNARKYMKVRPLTSARQPECVILCQ